jgi:hypothetical protein
MLEAITALLLLFLGDFLSTFCYHVPEHVFGHLHLQTHHTAKKNFRHYAVLTFNRAVLLDGLLGAFPYLALGTVLWFVSPVGVMIGLVLGQFHVWWRHTCAMGWQTHQWLIWLCKVLCITTPEQHWLHHQKITLSYGDIFTVFDQPAKTWFRWLRLFRLQRPWSKGFNSKIWLFLD